MNKQFFQFIVMVVSALMSTGCFTGIESTPKITAGDVKREKVVVTAEQQYMDSITVEPFSQWVYGKRFYVTDDKIRLIFGASSFESHSLAGKFITYKECRHVTSLTGDVVAELIFVDDEGYEYNYRMGVSPEELATRSGVDVPFSVEETLVEAAKVKLKGKNFYILTSIWYDTNDEITYGRKFVQVKIEDVMPGNHVYPLRLVFKDETGKDYRMFMSIGNDYKAPRSFSSLFSFENPRIKYPNISDNVWNKIIEGKVELDMTRDECRLSLGTPKEIDRRPGYSGVREMWIYENGAYLIFEDGLLHDFRADVINK